MIYLYHGTGGSGKSLHMAQDIVNWIDFKKKNVIANFPVNTPQLYDKFRHHGRFYFFDNDVMNVKNLVKYARHLHKPRVEGQTLLCIDECQYFYDPRDNVRRDRREWLRFFTQHRKLGFDVILTCPSENLIDKQILGCIEYTVKHRKVNNAGFIGKLLPFSCFCAVTRWRGVQGKEGVMGKDFFRYHKKYDTLYDSYKFFEAGRVDTSKNVFKNIQLTAQAEPAASTPTL